MNINYTFMDKKLLDTALCHISLANDTNTESNQRLEFLGDSILSFVVAEHIYKEYKKVDEGVLTVIRANAVCEKTLAIAAVRLGLGDGLRLGKSEEVSHGEQKESVLADTFEAVLAAIYLDGGIIPAKKFVMDNLGDMIGDTASPELENYKSEIQSYYQKRDRNRDVVTYTLIEKTGPDHDPFFKVQAEYQGKVIGKGEGKSRKLAEQSAAHAALVAVKKSK